MERKSRRAKSLEASSELSTILRKGCKEAFSSEREFRERVVSRMLDLLGWNLPGEIRYEETIPTGTIDLRVDYIVADAHRKFALEVKMPGVSVSEGSPARLQLRSYLRLDESINFGVLYNGKEMHLFTRDKESPVLSWSCGKSNSILVYISKGIHTEKARQKSQSLKWFAKFFGYLAVGSIVFPVLFGVVAFYASFLNGILGTFDVIFAALFWIALFTFAYFYVKFRSQRKKELIVSERIGEVEKVTGE